jgi:hypothetical protein
MTSLLKTPLIIAAIVVVGRVIIERTNVVPQISNYLSAVVLTVLLAPLYFGLKIAFNRIPRPYATHLKATALYAVLVRAMILPVYWLAFYYGWPEQRFAIPPEAGTGPLAGYVIVPFLTAAFWILASIIVGGAIGALIIAVHQRVSRASTLS